MYRLHFYDGSVPAWFLSFCLFISWCNTPSDNFRIAVLNVYYPYACKFYFSYLIKLHIDSHRSQNWNLLLCTQLCLVIYIKIKKIFCVEGQTPILPIPFWQFLVKKTFLDVYLIITVQTQTKEEVFMLLINSFGLLFWFSWTVRARDDLMIRWTVAHWIIPAWGRSIWWSERGETHANKT
jgi:hypothetical protein